MELTDEMRYDQGKWCMWWAFVMNYDVWGGKLEVQVRVKPGQHVNPGHLAANMLIYAVWNGGHTTVREKLSPKQIALGEHDVSDATGNHHYKVVTFMMEAYGRKLWHIGSEKIELERNI